jgi:hypothetical protein
LLVAAVAVGKLVQVLERLVVVLAATEHPPEHPEAALRQRVR